MNEDRNERYALIKTMGYFVYFIEICKNTPTDKAV